MRQDIIAEQEPEIRDTVVESPKAAEFRTLANEFELLRSVPGS
jgi:hypothetical protein